MLFARHTPCSISCHMIWHRLFRNYSIRKKLTKSSKDVFVCSKRHKNYYITTPIFYVNSVPHLGHLYSATLADAAQRWKRLNQQSHSEGQTLTGKPFFATGTDEHGKKIYDAATKAKMDPLPFCDKVSEKFKDIFSLCNIEYSDFIRTTEQRHKVAVEAFWQRLEERGFIYKGAYEGWYSVQDEAFVSEKDTSLVNDQALGCEVRISVESGHKVEWMKEDNYMFRLSDVLDKVKAWVDENPDCIYPVKFRDQLSLMLEKSPGDISISRERSRVPWGIEMPNDTKQTVYVWLDALINYLTVVGFPDTNSELFQNTWPSDVHLIGMDILKFHALYWPAFLIAAELPLPKQIIVHSHWLMNGRKMSKSIGNVVDPFKLSSIVTGEGLRYFLLKQGVIEHDCDYSPKILLQSVNGDLCNTLGNCLNRAVAPKLNPQQIYPPFHKRSFPLPGNELSQGYDFQVQKEDYNLIKMVRSLPERTEPHMEVFHFYKAAEDIMECVREANAVIQRNSVWRLDQSKTGERELSETVIHCVYETLRVCAIILQVFVPDMANKTLNRLNVAVTERTLAQARRSFYSFDGDGSRCPMTGRKLGTDVSLLINRVSKTDIENLKNRSKVRAL